MIHALSGAIHFVLLICRNHKSHMSLEVIFQKDKLIIDKWFFVIACLHIHANQE